jgi:hypothetical protein
MPIPAFDSVPDAQANLNFKIFTDAAAAVPLLMSQNAASHAKRVDVLAENLLATVGNKLHSVDVVEAVSAKQMLTGDERADLAGIVALAQVMTKTAQTTPPPTHGT